MPLPSRYAWLAKELAPKMLVEAIKLHGTLEMPGDKDDPTIMAWAAETGLERVYSHDSVPWCGLFMAVVAKRAGKEIPKDPLWALNWANFGTKQTVAMLGDVLVFRRNNGGHVSIYVGEDDSAYHCLGGNQSDSVNITRVGKSRLYAIRRSIWKIAQPGNVRRIILEAGGELSKNEA